MRWASCLLVVVGMMIGVAAAHGATITVAEPAAGITVSGVVPVKATITLKPGEDVTSPVVQTMDGERAPLFSDGAGTYVGMVDTRKLPNGHQTLLVFVTPRVRDAWREKYDDASWGPDRMASQAEVALLVRNPYRFCWGDIHAHTSYSDGGMYPADAYRHARDQAKLEFFSVTDHDWITTMDEYADIIAQADSFDEPGRFVALWGVERTNGDTGHMCYYMTRANEMPNGLTDFYRAVGEKGILAHFNHPWKNGAEASWRNDFQDFRYSPEGDRSMAMVELRDPGEEECYIAMLNNGWHVGAAGDEDKHDATWGDGPTWTVALARELTREGILEALWARRTYSAADRNLRLELTLDGEDMGAQLSRPAGKYEFSISISDPDEADKIERVDMFLDGRIASSLEPQKATAEWTGALEFPAGRHYCFVRVTQTGKKITWSSPIWVSAYEYVPLPMKKK